MNATVSAMGTLVSHGKRRSWHGQVLTFPKASRPFRPPNNPFAIAAVALQARAPTFLDLFTARANLSEDRKARRRRKQSLQQNVGIENTRYEAAVGKGAKRA